MNLVIVGSAFLAAMHFGPGVPKAPAEPVSTTAERPTAERVLPPEQKVAKPHAAAGPEEDRGWMTREIITDQKTGETTEVSVIGFAD